MHLCDFMSNMQFFIYSVKTWLGMFDKKRKLTDIWPHVLQTHQMPILATKCQLHNMYLKEWVNIAIMWSWKQYFSKIVFKRKITIFWAFSYLNYFAKNYNITTKQTLRPYVTQNYTYRFTNCLHLYTS